MLALARMAAGCIKRAAGSACPLAGFRCPGGCSSAAAPLGGMLPPPKALLSSAAELAASTPGRFGQRFDFALARGFGTAASPRQQPDTPLPAAIKASNLNALRSIILDHGPHFRYQHFSAAFCRISALQASGVDCEEALRRLGSCIHHALLHKSLRQFSIVIILHSLATLRAKHRDLVDRAMGSQLSAGTPSQPSFIDRLAQGLVEVGFEGFTPQNVPNCMWAVAKLEYRHDGLLQMCMRRALAVQFSGFNAHGLSNCLYAAGTVEFNIHEKGAFALIRSFICDCMTACRRLGFQHFTEQGLANIFWAVGTLRNEFEDMLPVAHVHDFADAWLTYVASWGLRHFTEQGVANIFVGLFKLRHYNSEFLAQLRSHAVGERLSQFTTQGRANVIHALATFWDLSNDFVLSWSTCINASVVQKFSMQHATVSLWSLAVWHTMLSVGALPPADRGTLEAADRAIQLLFCRVLQLHGTIRGREKVKFLTQVYQVMDRVPQGETLRMMRPALSRACFDAACNSPAAPSIFQGQVFDSLKAMGHDVSEEVKTPDGAMTVDIVLRARGGRRIAIEVDGPNHFSSNKPYRLDGASHMRNVLLRQRGFDDVICVPFYELDYDATEQQAQEYLAAKLKPLGIVA